MADKTGYIGRNPGDSSVAVARQIFSPTGVQTNFTFASGYDVGYLDLYLNGIRLIEGQDYNATDTSTVGLTSFAQNGDILEAVAYKAFNLGDVERIGIQSAGTTIGNARILNFVGTGNTFAVNGTTIDVSISGGAGAGGTWATYDSNTGITTSKKVRVQNDVEVTGVATFSSNVTVGGVLTYDDVTNVDSVGIITARSHVSIADSILHTGDTDTSIRFPSANTFTVETGGTEALRVRNDQRVQITSGSAEVIAAQDTSAQLRLTADEGDDGSDYWRLESNHSTNQLNFASYATGAWVDRVSFTSTGEVRVGSAFSVSQAGVCTAAEFHGDGSNLTGIDVGLSTEAGTASGIVTHVRLSSAQDHKITATGFTTITSSGSGTEGESHTIRIVNSGIATVGFSTYFLFPSGAAPSLPTADGAISLISFTVHDSVGAGCTQLLAGASVNYS